MENFIIESLKGILAKMAKEKMNEETHKARKLAITAPIQKMEATGDTRITENGIVAVGSWCHSCEETHSFVAISTDADEFLKPYLEAIYAAETAHDGVFDDKFTYKCAGKKWLNVNHLLMFTDKSCKLFREKLPIYKVFYEMDIDALEIKHKKISDHVRALVEPVIEKLDKRAYEIRDKSKGHEVHGDNFDEFIIGIMKMSEDEDDDENEDIKEFVRRN